jgi:putative ABC transport system permease protein
MISHKVLMNLSIAAEAVLANRMRSILTGLGIIFGVAAVIAMLAVGNGAQQEIIDQMKLVGVNNIVIKPIIEQSEEEVTEDGGPKKKKFSSGLNWRDVQVIKEIVPGIEKISPEIILDTYLMNNGIRRTAKLIGIEPSYFELFNFQLERGKDFSQYHLEHGSSVCIIGNSIKTKFFPFEDPIGKYIKCGNNWLKVIGILKKRVISQSSIQSLGIRDYNMDVYTPLQTVLIRIKNRAIITEQMIKEANQAHNFVEKTSESDMREKKNYHQLDKLVLQVDKTESLTPIAEIINRLLERRHNKTIDFEIEIPELLLKQQQRTNDIFNYVLGAIAGISLLVGGIGIMNIMLASVLERIKEIGLRMSMGAKQQDIVNQFLFEAMMISITGGLIGVILGVSFAFLVSSLADIPTVITFSSIVLSFGVAAAVGLIFGIAPARKAAKQDPITSLRYE